MGYFTQKAAELRSEGLLKPLRATKRETEPNSTKNKTEPLESLEQLEVAQWIIENVPMEPEKWTNFVRHMHTLRASLRKRGYTEEELFFAANATITEEGWLWLEKKQMLKNEQENTATTITKSGYKIANAKKQDRTLLYHFIVSGGTIGKRHVDIRHVAKALDIELDSIAGCVGCNASQDITPDYMRLCDKHRREALSLLLSKLDDPNQWLEKQEAFRK